MCFNEGNFANVFARNTQNFSTPLWTKLYTRNPARKTKKEKIKCKIKSENMEKRKRKKSYAVNQQCKKKCCEIRVMREKREEIWARCVQLWFSFLTPFSFSPMRVEGYKVISDTTIIIQIIKSVKCKMGGKKGVECCLYMGRQLPRAIHTGRAITCLGRVLSRSSTFLVT